MTATGSQIICNTIPELSTEQEEADTRIILHAKDAALYGSTNIIIKSPDTDIAVLACSLSHEIPSNLFFLTDMKQRTRYIAITATVGGLSQDLA